jgi:hypothetical protein
VGAHLTVHSRPERGTTIEVRWPPEGRLGRTDRRWALSYNRLATDTILALWTTNSSTALTSTLRLLFAGVWAGDRR